MQRQAWLVFCGALIACGDDNGATPDAPASTIHLEGSVTLEAAPLASTVITLRVQDTLFADLATVETTTTAAGTFAFSLQLDTLIESSRLSLIVMPPYGSGIRARMVLFPLQHNPAGAADSTDLAFAMIRDEAAVPTGPTQPVTAVALAGFYSGRSVAPLFPSRGGAFWDLELLAQGDSMVGTYESDFTASTTCGNSLGTLTGRVSGNTLQLRMISDSFSGDDIGRRVTLLNAVAYTADLDTLILTYPTQPGPNPCAYGSPSPLRLIRE